MISLRFHFEIGDFVKSPRESIWSKRGDGPRQLLCDVRSAVQRRGRSTVTQAVVKILTFEHGEKAKKKRGTKLVLDVSNDAISIHIYFRPVHEWLLLTNELSSPPKSGEWCHALFVRRDAEPNGANSWSQRPCPETSGAISRRGANCLAQTWNVRNVSG